MHAVEWSHRTILFVEQPSPLNFSSDRTAKFRWLVPNLHMYESSQKSSDLTIRVDSLELDPAYSAGRRAVAIFKMELNNG